MSLIHQYEAELHSMFLDESIPLSRLAKDVVEENYGHIVHLVLISAPERVVEVVSGQGLPTAKASMAECGCYDQGAYECYPHFSNWCRREGFWRLNWSCPQISQRTLS